MTPNSNSISKYPEGDFNVIIAKGQEDIYVKLSAENAELKDCLRSL